MVIDASRIFTCAHTYVAVKESGVLLFACASCGYKTELLPLHKQPRATRKRASRRNCVDIGWARGYAAAAGSFTRGM